LVQDQFIKKSDFEITDLELMREHYECLGRSYSDLGGHSNSLQASFIDNTEKTPTAPDSNEPSPEHAIKIY